MKLLWIILAVAYLAIGYWYATTPCEFCVPATIDEAGPGYLPMATSGVIWAGDHR